MAFVGRTQELGQIRRALARDEQQAILVFGRRRVGKSELIKEAVKKADGTVIYYECKQTAEASNVASLAALVAEAYGIPRPAFASMEEALGYLFRTPEEEDTTLVLDEYPFLRDAVRSLDSVIQALLDKHRDSSRMHLILCGSYIDIMKSLMEKENPLYGRIDLTIDLKPMDYLDSSLFYPDFSNADKVRLYSVFGGIPHYNRLIDPSLTVRENIVELVVEPGARLENEISLYLSSQISKITNANEVFGALAEGYSRFKDIRDQSHVSSGPTLVDVLDKLIRMELVQRQVPINDPENRKKGGYVISDGLSLFYYRYVFRYLSQRSVLDPGAFYDRYIEKDFESRYVPHAFEEVCRQFLVRQNRSGKMEPPFDAIGRYHNDDPASKTNGEFDVVTHDECGYAFYEAKFRAAPITQKMVDEEIEQVSRTGLDCYRHGFFSRSGFDVEPCENLVLIDLSELYKV